MKRFMTKWKLMAISVVAVTVTALGASSAAFVYAQSNSASDGPILSGLWQGINLFSSDTTTSTTEGSQTSSSTESYSETQSSSSSSPTQAAPESGTYVALGDSVVAGLGLPAIAQGAICGRSYDAYPYLVAAERSWTVTNISCSGAKAGDLFSKQSVSGPNLDPQLDTAFRSSTPDVITITAGANDVHWSEFLRACYATSCGGNTQSAIADGYRSLLTLKLHYLFNDISARSNGQPPRTIITGYYNPLSQACTDQYSQITENELVWLQDQLSMLNTTIQDVAAQYGYVTYLPIDFTGHDICSNDSWVQGVNDAAPFHPTAQGQQEIANAINAAL